MAISSHCFWPWDRLPGWRWAVPWPRCPGAGLSGGWCTWIAYVSLPRLAHWIEGLTAWG